METPKSQTLTLTDNDFQLFADRYRKPLKKHLNLWELLPKEIEEYILEYNVIPYLHEINESNKLYLKQYLYTTGDYFHRRRVIKPTINHDDNDLIEVDKNKKFKVVKMPYNKFAYKLYRHHLVRTNKFTAWIDYIEDDCGFEYKEEYRYFVREKYFYWLQVCRPTNSRETLMKYCDENNITYKPKTGTKFLVKWLKECAE